MEDSFGHIIQNYFEFNLFFSLSINHLFTSTGCPNFHCTTTLEEDIHPKKRRKKGSVYGSASDSLPFSSFRHFECEIKFSNEYSWGSNLDRSSLPFLEITKIVHKSEAKDK